MLLGEPVHRFSWTNYPLNPLSPVGGGDLDAFVAKIDVPEIPLALVYSTYLGGDYGPDGYGIAVDSSGNVYITGTLILRTFPHKSLYREVMEVDHGRLCHKDQSFRKRLAILHLSQREAAMMWGFGIAVDNSGNAYITGYTESTNFFTQTPIQGSNAGSGDVFVTKINSSGSAVYSTYLGGGGWGW